MTSRRTKPRQPNPWPTFALCSLALFLVAQDTTILFVAFHGIRTTFTAASPAALPWILNAYTIVFGSLLVPAGRLADLYGRKRVFLIGVALFTLASALCGFAPSALALIGFGILQGIGA